MNFFLRLKIFLLVIIVSPKVIGQNIFLTDTSISYDYVYSNQTISRLDIGGVAFLKSTNLSNDTLLYADFSVDTVFNKGNFRNTIFLSGVGFIESEFRDSAIFSNANFSHDVFFSSGRFLKIVDFSHATFSRKAFFYNVRFGKIAHFNNLFLTDSSDFKFDGAVFPDTINFSYNSKIPNEIDLITANFTDPTRYNRDSDKYIRPHFIYLYKSDISKFHIDYIHFKLINDSTLDFPKKKIPNDEIESIYQALLNNFKTRGQDESYKLLDIEYQKFKWKNSWAWWLTWLPEVWWNFGYDKEYIFVWTFFLIFIFTSITFFWLNYLNQKVYKVEQVPLLWHRKNVSLFAKNKLARQEFGKRVWYSFVYTSTIFFRLTLKIENINFKEKGGTFYLIILFTVGIICLA